MDIKTGAELWSISSDEIDDSGVSWVEIALQDDEGLSEMDGFDEPDWSRTFNWMQGRVAPTGERVVMANDIPGKNPYASHFLVMTEAGEVLQKIKAPFAHHSFDLVEDPEGGWRIVYLKLDLRNAADFDIDAGESMVAGDQVVVLNPNAQTGLPLEGLVRWSSFDHSSVRTGGFSAYGSDVIDDTHASTLNINSQGVAVLSFVNKNSVLELAVEEGSTWVDPQLYIRRLTIGAEMSPRFFREHESYDGYPIAQAGFRWVHGAHFFPSAETSIGDPLTAGHLCLMDNQTFEYESSAVCLSFETSELISPSESRVMTSPDDPLNVLMYGNILPVAGTNEALVNWGSSCSIERVDLETQDIRWRHEEPGCFLLGYSSFVSQDTP